MSTLVILALLFIGLLGGFLSGLAGLGGGVIIVPLLILFLGLTQKEAQGVSIGVLVPPIGILAFYNYYKAGQVNLQYVWIIALTFILGSFLGSKLAISLSTVTLKKIFAIVIILIGFKTLLFDK